MTHPHLEGLIRKWRAAGPFLIEQQHVIYDQCADELEAALAALPGGGVNDDMVHRACDAYSARSIESDRGRVLNPTSAMYSALTAALSPTPNPHEADQS